MPVKKKNTESSTSEEIIPVYIRGRPRKYSSSSSEEVKKKIAKNSIKKVISLPTKSVKKKVIKSKTTKRSTHSLSETREVDFR